MRSACSPGFSLSCVRSPVKRTRSGRSGSALTISTARSNAFVPSGSGGPSNPTCVSENWTNENGVGRSPFFLPSSPMRRPPSPRAGAATR